MDAGDGGDPTVGCAHRATRTCPLAHQLAVAQRGLFGKGEDAPGKAAAPGLQAIGQPLGVFTGADLAEAEGQLGNHHRAQRQLGMKQGL